MILHTLFDLLAAASALTMTVVVYRWRLMDAGQKITLPEALQAYTEHGAFSQKQEVRKGRLIAGQLADVAVFSRNLFEASPDEILHDTRIDLTICDGKVAYQRV